MWPAVEAGCHPVPEPLSGDGIQSGPGCDMSIPGMSVFDSAGSSVTTPTCAPADDTDIAMARKLKISVRKLSLLLHERIKSAK
jgi:hypothetical protein